jgi:hypothetical protein
MSAPLGAIYASVALLLIGTTTEIFVPYFLQLLHGHSPLAAGYLTAAMAGGWSAGSLLSSGRSGAGADRMLRAGPVACTLGLVALRCCCRCRPCWARASRPCWSPWRWRPSAWAWASAGRTW